jgi:hypothetical protein
MNDFCDVLLHGHALLGAAKGFSARNGAVSLEVKPSAECSTGTGEYDHPATVIVMDCGESFVERIDELNCQRIHVVWTVERDAGDTRSGLVKKNWFAHSQILAGGLKKFRSRHF